MTILQSLTVIALTAACGLAVYGIATGLLTLRVPSLTDDFHAGRGAGDEAEG